MNEFGEFLYKLRKEKGMTQAELAKLLGVTNKAVSKWETGEAMPETSQLLPLAQIFNVTVDELLAGSRRERSEDGESERIEDNLFTRGKDDDDDKTLFGKIRGAVCAATVFVGLTVFFLMGIISDLWHPYWAIIPCSALLSGIIGLLFDVCNARQRAHKFARGENPYTGAVCGILMLASIIAYLIAGAFFQLWHPLWIIPVVAAFLCGMIAMLIEIITHKNK